MMQQQFVRVLGVLALIFVVLAAGCSPREITRALTDLKNLQFKLRDVDNFRLAGITLADKKSIKDFSLSDGLALTRAITSETAPAEFTVNVIARNPNDGQAGRQSAQLTITSLDYRLLIDGRQTISGDIEKPIYIPGSKEETVFPLKMKLDLLQFFSDKGKDGILNLALALGGVEGSASRISIDMRPTVKSSLLGEIRYPGRLLIVDKEFSN